MLFVHNLSKSFGIETLFESVSFVINPGERVGLVGPNGCGKTTLFRILTGEITSDGGSISLAPGTTLGYMPQSLAFDETLTVEDVCWTAIPSLAQAHHIIEDLAPKLAHLEGDDLDSSLEEYGEALNQYEALGGYQFEHQVYAILDGLGLGDLDRRKPVLTLSGGQRTRLNLARLLLGHPNLLLLDEPTNHLDIEALEWLESFLNSYPGAVLVISHDRAFLDNTITRTLALNPESHQLRSFSGNYSRYVEIIQAELSNQWEQWNDQEVEIHRMEQDIHRTKHHALSVELTTTSRQPNVRRLAKKVAKKAASREKKLKRYLKSDDRVEKPQKGWEMKLDFFKANRSGEMVAHLEKVYFHYPDGPALLTNISAHLHYKERVALVGANGSGKSTLLKLITGALQPIKGVVTLGTNVQIGYMAQEQETLPGDECALSYIQGTAPMSETDTRNFLHYFLFEGDEVFTLISRLSHGERSRLILAQMVVKGANLLVLDEPTNHLDIPSRERFETALQSFPGTILISTHDRILIQRLAQKTWLLKGGLIQEIYHPPPTP